MERQQALDQAFAAGVDHERKRVDEAWKAECVELRVERDALRVRLERRESWRATLMNVGVAALIFGCWALVALVVFLVAS